jgi:phage gp29-like protein
MRITKNNKMKILNYFRKEQTPESVGNGFQIVQQPPDRAAKDLAKWKTAIQAAEMVGYKRRTDLLDIYTEQLDMDAHLFGVIEKRKKKILGYELLYLRNDKVDEKVTEWLQADKFGAFIADLIDYVFWGYTVFSFEAIKGNWFEYYLVPRKHVNPYKKMVLKNQYDGEGMSYLPMMEGIRPTVSEVGSADDLGLLKTLTYYSILKRNGVGDWFTYLQEAGRNFKTVKVKGGDVSQRKEAVNAMKNLGAGGELVLPDGVDMELISGASSSQNQLFENAVKWCDEQMSKLVLGGIMTTDTGSSRAQAEVHQDQQGTIEQADKEFVLNYLNYIFTDYLWIWGINPGGMFDFKESLDVAGELEKDLKLKELGVINTSELYEKYSIEKPENVDTGSIAQSLGVGGLQALQAIISDPNLTEDQKINTLEIVFGIEAVDAKRIVKG